MDLFRLILLILIPLATFGLYKALRDVQFIYRSPKRYVVLMKGRTSRFIVAAGVVLMADFFIHSIAGFLA